MIGRASRYYTEGDRETRGEEACKLGDDTWRPSKSKSKSKSTNRSYSYSYSYPYSYSYSLLVGTGSFSDQGVNDTPGASARLTDRRQWETRLPTTVTFSNLPPLEASAQIPIPQFL